MSELLTFSADELDLLGRTADALSAYMGKPVLAEVIAEPEGGYEWALFALPLKPDEDVEDRLCVQVGGAGARFLGQAGGLDTRDGQPLECEFLWGIQRADLEGVRYIKVDGDGEESAWSDTLQELLPFDLRDVAPPEDEEDGAEDNDGAEDDDSAEDNDERGA